MGNPKSCPHAMCLLLQGLITGSYRLFIRNATDSTQTRDRFNADWPIKRDRFNAHNFHNPQLFVDKSELFARPVPSHSEQSTKVSATCSSQPRHTSHNRPPTAEIIQLVPAFVPIPLCLSRCASWLALCHWNMCEGWLNLQTLIHDFHLNPGIDQHYLAKLRQE